MHTAAASPKPSRRKPYSEKPLPIARAVAGAPRRKAKTTSLPPTDRVRRIFALELQVETLRNRVLHLQNEADTLAHRLNRKNNQYDNSPVGDLVFDEHGIILEANQRAGRILGYTDPSITDVPFTHFIERACRDRFLSHLRENRLIMHPACLELELRLPDKSRRIVELIIQPLRRGAVPRDVRFRAILIDITARDTAREALRIAQENYRALIDSIQGIVWEADPRTFEIFFVSQSAERILGYPIGVWSQAGFWSNHIYVADRERVMLEVTKALAAGEGNYTVDYRVLDANRNCLWFRDSITIFTHHGKQRLLGVAVEITDRKELEEKLEEVQTQLEQRVEQRTAELTATVADLEAFSYSISHDLRAPLRAMEGYAQLLLQRLGENIEPIDRDFLMRIGASAQRLDSLIQNVLKYSRVSREPIQIHSVNVEKLVDGIIQDYPGLQLPRAEIDVQKPLPEVKGNEAFLTQCVSNLLSNAVKFVKPGENAKVRVWSEDVKDRVRLWFQDNGIGIPAEAQRRIFGIFQRLHGQHEYEGTGIGLAVVKKAAERMGGKVGLESIEGQGSKFWLELPRA